MDYGMKQSVVGGTAMGNMSVVRDRSKIEITIERIQQYIHQVDGYRSRVSDVADSLFGPYPVDSAQVGQAHAGGTNLDSVTADLGRALDRLDSELARFV